MTEIPAGWYPDPDPAAVERRLRYWDGSAWTEHVAPAPAARSGPTTPDGEPLAGWWWRVLAYVIDSIIVGIVSTLVGLPAQIGVQRDLTPVIEEFNRSVEQDPENVEFGAFISDYLDVFQDHAFWLTAPSVVLTLVFWVGFLRWQGGTPGKLMLGMRVRLRDRPGRLPWSAIVARTALQFGITWFFYVWAFASGSGAIWLLAALVFSVMLLDPLWASWDAKRQAWHDKVARTNVVRPG